MAITDGRLRAFLSRMTEDGWDLAAPVSGIKGPEFCRTEEPGTVCLSDEPTWNSPKEFLFPQQEIVLRFDAAGEPQAPPPPPKTLLFGLRPCDLYAFRVLRRVFAGGKYQDPLYSAHQENTLLVGLGCREEKPGCFCSERGVGKNDPAGADLFFHPQAEGWSLEIVTQAGGRAVGHADPGLEAESRVAGEEGQRAPAESLFLTGSETGLFEKTDWAALSETCIGCGVCTYLCTACHCFRFRDVAGGGCAARYRAWDSCMYPGFTLHASGHNPRATNAERFRQRVLHKFLYIPENQGMAACGGCGRCVRACPGGISIRNVVRAMMEGSP